MMLSYKAKKNKVVFLLSYKYKAILDYNYNKAGVDTANKMLRSYSTKVLSRRWPLAAFFNLQNIVSLNTYIKHTDISLSGQNRR